MLHTVVVNDERETISEDLKEAEKVAKLKHPITSLPGSTLSEMRLGWHFFSDCRHELSELIYEAEN